MALPNLIFDLVWREIPITLVLRDSGEIGYDINTGAKSGVVLVETGDNVFTAYMRYSETEDGIETVEDVLGVVRSAMHGRDGVAKHWMDLFIEYGYAKVETTTHTKITF